MTCDGDPSAQTLEDMGVNEIFRELEEVPVTVVGGLDVHRQQITFDYVDDDGSGLQTTACEYLGTHIMLAIYAIPIHCQHRRPSCR
jgi:hypothetical protein